MINDYFVMVVKYLGQLILLVSGGNASFILTVAQLSVHDHDRGSLITVIDGLHTHLTSDPGHNHGGATGSATASVSSGSNLAGGFSLGNGLNSHTHTHTPINTGATGITIQFSGSHSHVISGSTGLQGLGQPIDKTPPFQTVHYMIRT
ncbi:unnamed protein product [Rotaria socialis]